jgi:hypothetical protein
VAVFKIVLFLAWPTRRAGTRAGGAREVGAYRNVLRICPPLGTRMGDVSFFEAAINRSFESLQDCCLGYNSGLIELTEERHVRNTIDNAGDWQPGARLFVT